MGAIENKLNDAHLDALLSARTTSERFDALHACARSVGFDDVSFLAGLTTERPGNELGKRVSRIHHISSCSGEWLDSLFETQAVEQDYDIQRFLAGLSSPFVSGHNILALMEPLDPPQRAILEKKAEAGFAANFIVPLPTTPFARGCYAAIMFISKMTEASFSAAMIRRGSWLTACAHIFHHSVGGDALTFVEREANLAVAAAQHNCAARRVEFDLTARQQEVLVGLAQGRRLAEIAAHLNVSMVTVDRHAKAVRSALDAKTNIEAVAKAVSLGLIDPEQ